MSKAGDQRVRHLVLYHSLFFGFIQGGMGNVFFARVGLRNYTGKSRCIPTLRRDTSGLTHATHRATLIKALEGLSNDRGHGPSWK